MHVYVKAFASTVWGWPISSTSANGNGIMKFFTNNLKTKKMKKFNRNIRKKTQDLMDIFNVIQIEGLRVKR